MEQTEQTTEQANTGAAETAKQETAPAEKTPQEKMATIVSSKAGTAAKPAASPPEGKPAEEKQEAKPAETAAKKENAGTRIKQLSTRLREGEKKIAEMAQKYAEIAEKIKAGEATELDEYKAEQSAAQLSETKAELQQDYYAAAKDTLGDAYGDFEESNRYYTPLLNEKALEFSLAVARMPNQFEILSALFGGFNSGSVDWNQFIALPVPRQMGFLKALDYNLKNPKPATQQQAAPAAEPPKVPVPSDVAIGGAPKDKNAMMKAILQRKAGMV